MTLASNFNCFVYNLKPTSLIEEKESGDLQKENLESKHLLKGCIPHK
jgi:hypothetical protein